MSNDVSEGEVDRCREESGCKCDAANPDEEAVQGERVFPRHDATNVADNLSSAAKDHCTCKVWFPGINALHQVEDETDAKEGEEANVGCERGSVVHNRLSDIALREVTGVEVRHDGGVNVGRVEKIKVKWFECDIW